MSRSKHAARERKRAAREAARRAARRRQHITIGVGIAVVVGLFGLLIVSSLGGGGDGVTLAGDTSATGWDLPALDDGSERVALADFSGSPTVAVFFASWCEVCEAEIPGFVTLSEQLDGRVDFVGINSQDNGRGGGDAARWGIDERWPLARDVGLGDGRGLATGTFGARGMPMTVIYDGTGQVVHVQRGGISAEGLLSILRANALA